MNRAITALLALMYCFSMGLVLLPQANAVQNASNYLSDSAYNTTLMQFIGFLLLFLVLGIGGFYLIGSSNTNNIMITEEKQVSDSEAVKAKVKSKAEERCYPHGIINCPYCNPSEKGT